MLINMLRLVYTSTELVRERQLLDLKVTEVDQQSLKLQKLI